MIVEHPINRATPMPKVFSEIIKSDAERQALHDKGFEMTQADWRRIGTLIIDKRKLRRAAEEILSWNANKGKTP